MLTHSSSLRRWLSRPLLPAGVRRGTGRRGRVGIERLETRAVPATIAFSVQDDGLAADRDLDGTFETAVTSGTTISDRWFDTSGIGQERGVFEFDLSRIAAGTPILSARLGFDVASFTSSTLNGVVTNPQMVFRASVGDGAVTAADGAAASVAAGTKTVTATGYQEVALDPAAFQSLAGRFASLRFQNTALDAEWVEVAALESTSHAHATLTLEIPDTPTLGLAVTPGTFSEAAGPNAATGELTRTGDVSSALAVNLASGDTTELTVPSSVTFPAGKATVSFPVSAVDDSVFDGTQSVTVTATANTPVGSPVGLDTTFGSGGLAATPLEQIIQFPREAIARQPDGKILAASEYSGNSWQIIRLNPDGSPDTTFGTGGVTVTNLTTPTATGLNNPRPHKIVVQSDGKIMVGGEFTSGYGTPALARYNADGTPDTTFGPYGDGVANVDFLKNVDTGWIDDMAVRPDGRILVAVPYNGTVSFRVAQLQADGSPDAGFGSFGVSVLPVGGVAHSVSLLPDGRFIVAGSAVGTGEVARVLANGTLDTTFGTGGTRSVTFGNRSADLFDSAIDSAGRIVLGADVFTNNVSGSSDMGVARLTADGALDTTYGNGGTATVDFFGLNDIPTSMELQPDDKVVLAGLSNITTTERYSSLARFNPDGTPDATFDGDGEFAQSLHPSVNEMIFATALQPDGKLLALTGWFHDLRVARLNMGVGSAVVTATTTVRVLDDDNGPPVINAQSFTVAENSPNGMAVGTVIASDPNPGQTLTYAITAGNSSGAFAINSTTGALTVADSSKLDYEATPSFSLTVRVTDNGSPALSATATVTVNLTNVNESPLISGQTFTIAENSANGTAVGTVAASDPDAGQTLIYAITAGNGSGAFAINPATGAISVADSSKLDYEASPSFALTVRVTDNGSPVLSSTATVTIRLTNVNESPVIVGQSFSVAENSANGTAVGTVLASDPDAGQTLSYAITAGNGSGAFAINSTTGAISVADASKIDYETAPSFTLTVLVTDNGTPTLSATATVTVNLANVNESPLIASQSFTIAENSANGTAVGTVVASDPDAGQTLTYAITAGNGSGAFAINPTTGALTVADSSKLDYATTPVFSLTVRVTDNGTPALSANASVVINLTNVNESPVIAGQSFSVAENSANGTAVGTVLASDPDAGQTLSYAITAGNGSGAFAINSATGALTVADASKLDYEATPSFALTVRVTDNGTPALSATATIKINLINVNESPTAINQAFAIAENSASGVLVGTFVASDPDAGQTLSYAIIAGNGSGAFAINSATGALTVADASKLDYEATPSFTLTVRVTDNGNPALSTTATATIHLTDVNESPLLSAQSFTIAGNSANGTAVGTVAASDPDAGQTLTYAITAGNGSGAFAIDPKTGAITVADSSKLDYATTPVFSLVVQVTDSGSPALSSDAVVTINLTDVSGPLPVTLDLTPGDATSRLVLGRDKWLKVAILSTPTFDVRSIDLSSLRFGVTGTEDSFTQNKHGLTRYSFTDVNGDGLLDLVLTADVSQMGPMSAGDVEVRLTGSLDNGRTFAGTDTILAESKRGK